MIKFKELRPGAVIRLNDEGILRDGVVVKTSPEEHQLLVDNGIQEFWFNPEDLIPIPLDEEQLLRFGFTAEEFEGGVKYKKDSFRLVTPEKGNFSNLEMWWREDRRHFHTPLTVHEFQHLYHDMTKAFLDLP